ncbi:MAG: amidohydrolase family protein [Bdellovibrio sp.]|nr:amidohydrolase family protein [Bdellovibrio sp.]
MKILLLFFTLIFSIFSEAQEIKPLVLIGQMPGRYFAGTDAHAYVFGYVEIQNRVIQKIGQLKAEDLQSFQKENQNKKIIQLKRAGQSTYDVIYPGLIDLHKHTKQNNLPIWGEAEGQFANRFEWRDWPNYKFAVSGNMNPWVDYARAVECATYRWSELQVMVLGTTYLQGPSSCVSNFSIQRVEDADSYISQKSSVQAPTDLVIPEDMQFVWTSLRPLIQTGKSYEQALTQTIKKYCPTIDVTAANINSPEMLKIFKDQDKLVSLCQKEDLPTKFIRYIYWIHPTIAGRKNYFLNKKNPPSAIIAHLAEGRRDDEYNQKEYEIVKLLGLDMPQMNFVHGVGIPQKDYPELAKKDIGLIWSPFSNLILYSQTLDVGAAFKAGVRLAIGSDWVPTGTKSVLEEVKVARNYIIKDVDGEKLQQVLSSETNKFEKIDEELFKMMTENPAKMIGHSEVVKSTDLKTNPSGYSETAIGTLSPGAMGSVIIASYQDVNPYTNLVKFTTEKDINLVVIDGRPIYGNHTYLDQLGLASQYEILPVDSDDYSSLGANANTEMQMPTGKTPEYKYEYLIKLVNSFASKVFKKTDRCQFTEEKAMVYHSSVEADEDLKAFKAKTNINLDRVTDITRILAINIMTQNRNKIDPVEGKPKFSLKYFPALYTCNDTYHSKRMSDFIKIGTDDVFQSNRKYRDNIIQKQNLGRGPKELARKYSN